MCGVMKRRMHAVQVFLRKLFVAPLALVLVFEEWGWEPLSRAFAWVARLPLWARVERLIQGLPRWGALLVFGLPVLALMPVKLLALYLFGTGHSVSGLLLLLSVKLVGTALMARLFQLTRPALMQYLWFSRFYPRWKGWKDGLIAWIRASPLWRQVRDIRLRVTAWWRAA